MRIHAAHRFESALVWCSSLLLTWGCAAERPESASAIQGSESSWFANLFTARQATVRDCSGLNSWFAENNSSFVSKVERADFTVELQYRPAACSACLEDRAASFTEPGFRARVAQLDKADLYVLRVRSATGRSDDGRRLNLSEDLLKDLAEVVGPDTLECAFVHVEALPSMLPYTSALVGFDRPQDGLDRRVILRDRSDDFGGDIIFQFSGLGRYTAILPDSLTITRS